jgi:hypothetical protein
MNRMQRDRYRRDVDFAARTEPSPMHSRLYCSTALILAFSAIGADRAWAQG